MNVGFDRRISFKKKRVTAAENMKNYKTCDEITGEISELKTKRHELESELKELQRKDKQARKYQLLHGITHSSTPVSPFSSDEDHSKQSRRLTLESSSPTTSSSYDPSTVDMNSSDNYQVDFSASRSATSSPSHAKNDTEFTMEEIFVFLMRKGTTFLMNGIKIGWHLTILKVQLEHLLLPPVLSLRSCQSPPTLQGLSPTCTEILPSSSHSPSDISLQGMSDSQDQMLSPNPQLSQQSF